MRRVGNQFARPGGRCCHRTIEQASKRLSAYPVNACCIACRRWGERLADDEAFFAAVPPNAAWFFVGERQVDQPTDVKVVKIDRGILLAGGKTIPESRQRDRRGGACRGRLTTRPPTLIDGGHRTQARPGRRPRAASIRI